MSISAITASAAVQGPQGPPKGRPEPPPLTTTADLLAMSTDGLRDAQGSGTTLTEMATTIADGKRPKGPPPPRRTQGSGDESQVNLESLADQLGVSSSDLLEQLTSGTAGSLAKSGYGRRRRARPAA